MAVFTTVSLEQARAFATSYNLGQVMSLHPIAEGVENTNYRLETTTGRYVLTLFEGRTDAASLPFCLGLTEHLADQDFPAPRPLRDRDGQSLGRLNDRPGAIIEWRAGAWLRAPSLADQTTAGATLARLHLAAQDYGGERTNPVGPAVWRRLLTRCETGLREGRGTPADASLLAEVTAALDALGDPWTDDLPRGPIHADYFPDNVLFENGAVSGVIDFYFGCVDALVYDLAIALSAWGFDAEGVAVPEAIEAFRDGYENVRPLSNEESKALPRLGQAAAIRFTATRLHDWIFHDPDSLVTPKDPAVFSRRKDGWSL